MQQCNAYHKLCFIETTVRQNAVICRAAARSSISDRHMLPLIGNLVELINNRLVPITGVYIYVCVYSISLSY